MLKQGADTLLLAIYSATSALFRDPAEYHSPYVDIGIKVDIRGLSVPRIVPVADTGEDLPDLSGDASRSFGCDSSTPVAFALDDPTAGAAFSMLPICSRCAVPRNAEDATDSVGLAGLSRGTSDTAVFEVDGVKASTIGRDGLRASRTLGGEVAEPLMIASLLRKSSNGAPPVPKSILMVRCERGVPANIGLRIMSETAR